MSSKLIPKNDRVLIKPSKKGEEMYGSIIIPDMGQERPEMGEVIAVGPGRTSEFGSFFELILMEKNILSYQTKKFSV